MSLLVATISALVKPLLASVIDSFERCPGHDESAQEGIFLNDRYGSLAAYHEANFLVS